MHCADFNEEGGELGEGRVEVEGERRKGREEGEGASHLETTPSFSISVGWGSVGDQSAMCGGLFNICTALTSRGKSLLLVDNRFPKPGK